MGESNPQEAWIQRFSSRTKALIAGALLIGVIAIVALVLLLGGSGLSDGAPCKDFVSSSSSSQSGYLSSKLPGLTGVDPPSTEEISGYAEGVRLNCSKGYGESIGESVERTHEEIGEENGSVEGGVELIRQRTEEREDFGELNQEFEEEERAQRELEGY